MLNRTLPEWVTFLLQAEVADTLVLHKLDVEALRGLLEGTGPHVGTVVCRDCKDKLDPEDVTCSDCLIADCEVEYRR